MNQPTRHRRICELLETRGECTVEEFTAMLGVTGMTIRRDLLTLAKQGKVIRTHGGATMAQRISFEFAFLNRARENSAAKRAIARAATAIIKDGQSVMLDSGTTTLALAQQLHGKKNVTVITTSLPIASELQYDPGIDVLLLGGYMRPGTPDLAGALTDANLETLRADLAFTGADGIDNAGIAYNQSPDVARMLTRMSASAREVYVVADGSKLGRTALFRYGNLKDWAGLITNQRAEPGILKKLKKLGVNVIKARGR